jgi:ABC-type polar amino acid transport system ATPase subunit
MPALYECRQLTKRYGTRKAVDAVSLIADRGQVLVIMGKSGSGKSTLLRNAALLEEPDDGTILLNGQQVFPDPAPRANARWRRRRVIGSRIGFVFQRFTLWPHRTVLGNVTEGLRVVKGLGEEDARRVAIAALESVQVHHLADAWPERLSGGESQRVAIARALAMAPELLCLDEITSALDPVQVAGVLTVLRRLSKEDKRTMIVVTHHIAFAREVADHIVFIENGRVTEEGPPAQVLQHPRSAELCQFLDAVGTTN